MGITGMIFPDASHVIFKHRTIIVNFYAVKSDTGGGVGVNWLQSPNTAVSYMAGSINKILL